MTNQRLLPMENWGVKVMSIGFLVDPMQAVIWRGPMASGAVKQFMSDVEWGELDYLVIDLPPGTGDIQLTLVQTIPLTGAVIVTTPQDISLADARKGVEMFEKVNVPVLGVVENMSYLHLHALRGAGGDFRQRRGTADGRENSASRSWARSRSSRTSASAATGAFPWRRTRTRRCRREYSPRSPGTWRRR